MGNPFPIPLNSVRAIEIVARQGALAPAAEELGVTPGAVSQHLRRAEQRLGMALFERTSRGLVPTETLKAVLPQLSAGFLSLAEALKALAPGVEQVLTLTVGSVFASRWLIWRIGRFSARYPDIELRLVVTGTVTDLAHSDIDCGIRFGRGAWPGIRAELIGGTSYRPVAAPSVAARLSTPADLARVPVIRDTASMLPWDRWFAAAGMAPVPTSGPIFADPALAFDAAISEQGVLMAVDMMAADAVSDGRLVQPFDIAADIGVGYWLVVAEGRREGRKLRLFREWLRSEVPVSANGYVAQANRREQGT